MFSWHERRDIIGETWFWVLMLVLLILVVSVVYYVVSPAFLNWQTNIYRHSYQYQETTQTQVVSLIAEWNRLDADVGTLQLKPGNTELIGSLKKQQAAVLAEAWQYARKLDPGQLSPSVSAFLMAHPSP